MANPDCSGNYTYYDYRNFPLQWYELNARMNPSLPAGEDNVSVHHRIRYGIAGGQRGIESLDSGLKLPWLYVHGGPGGGFSPDDHRMIDPDIYVPIMVVQRGSAGSGHEGNMQDVSVAHFIIDYVDVLAHLGISKAHFSGGSWGTTLVLKLLLEHPQLFMKLPTLRRLWIPSGKDLQSGKRLPDECGAGNTYQQRPNPQQQTCNTLKKPLPTNARPWVLRQLSVISMPTAFFLI